SYSLRAAALGASGGAVGVLHTPGVRPVVSTRPPQWGPRVLSYAQLRAAEEAHMPEGKPASVKLTLDGDVESYAWSVDGHPYPGEFVAPGAAEVPPLAVPAGARVELEIANRTALWQPIHLHGYRFRLLSAGGGTRAPWKDTVAIAPQGRVELEIASDAPGR